MNKWKKLKCTVVMRLYVSFYGIVYRQFQARGGSRGHKKKKFVVVFLKPRGEKKSAKQPAPEYPEEEEARSGVQCTVHHKQKREGKGEEKVSLQCSIKL